MSKTQRPYQGNKTPLKVVETLSACTNDRCNALADWIVGERDLEDLTHEDIFYPLKHHHELVLVVEEPEPGPYNRTERHAYEMRSDLLFPIEEESSRIVDAINPGDVRQGMHELDSEVWYTTESNYE